MPIEPWYTLLRAWLHDPVDKAADIRGHVARARRYARAVMGDEIAGEDLGGTPDHLASAYERLPMPGKNSGAPYVGPDSDGRVLMYHPLSAEGRRVALKFDEEGAVAKLGRMVRPDMSAEQRFLTLWRCAPEAEEFPETPADTRCPDHSLWQHLDTTAAIAWAIRGGKGATALLSFKISPVQPFIAASRSLHDLLSGSYLLSWLCFSAMVPVLGSCGPTALVYPALRGLPLMDWWLHQRGVDVSPDRVELGRASLPNRFLAIVPQGDAEILGARVREAAHAAWKAAARDVQARLKQKYDPGFPGWDRLWDAQIDSYFDFRTAWLGLADTNTAHFRDAAADANAKQVEVLADEEFARYQRAGQWQRAVDLSASLMRADGQVRHIPKYEPAGEVPQKCTLFGTYEQMGPARLSDSKEFWKKESPKDKEDSDRRCAVALVKKHAFKWHLQPKLLFDPAVTRFEEMNEIGGGENGYYAMLAMDGDDMGMWLSGEKSPKVRDILHPEILAWYEGQAARRAGLDARRPVSPSLHASISAALTTFAVKDAPGIVEKHGGKLSKLIYSGGDDLLAALPLHCALSCALELRNRFRSAEVMGSRAGMSAGLAVAHTKEDLRYVLSAARRAEHQAKHDGRDRLTLAVLRRSGERAFAGCAWEYVETVEEQVGRFRKGASDRWTYQMRRQMDVLVGMDEAAFEAELGRLIRHGETDLGFLEDFRRFQALCRGTDPREAFIGLCQSAAFLARGRDER